MSRRLLSVKNLHTSFFTHLGEVKALRGVSFNLNRGQLLGIVGESGSGKSVTSLSIMGLLQFPGRVVEGEILFKDRDLLSMTKDEMRKIRGRDISMIFQDPMTSLNPVYTISNQIMENIKEHEKASRKEALEKTIHFLELVGIPFASERVNSYPHEFSGGMRQRVMIAMALACSPELLIADEPTTALDVTIQAQILNLIRKLNRQLEMSTILITHDLGVVAELCDQILVMYGGLVMENGSADEIFYDPSHPYTLGLLSCLPKVREDGKKSRLRPIPGTPLDLFNPPNGCPFASRCKYTMNICLQEQPPAFQENTHQTMCWLMYESAPKNEAYQKDKEDIIHERA
ncbi:MAG: ABC transporter ATP-binding protein [Anaerolineaceae bacterium]|nr:ABC transporter ATP-binding protein [Anaerolineaceae bacterium]